MSEALLRGRLFNAQRAGPPTSLDRALDLLQELARDRSPRGVSELARAADLPKASAHRLLANLARRGFVEREGARYRLGFALAALGLAAVQGDPLIAAARPALASGAAHLRETTFLVSHREGALVVLDKIEGSGFVRAAPQVGASVPSHATAVGKLYRAFAPEHVSTAEATRFTAHTLSPAALARDVALSADRGWACNLNEWIDGLAVVAAPIWRPGRGPAQRELAGALAVAAATPVLERLGLPHVARELCERAREVTRRLMPRASGESDVQTEPGRVMERSSGGAR